MVFENWVSDEAMDLIYQMNRKLVENRISLDKVGRRFLAHLEILEHEWFKKATGKPRQKRAKYRNSNTFVDKIEM